MFDDRRAAGTALAAALSRAGVDPDLVVAIPRGGLPVARPVADAFGVPLDIVVARKIGAPSNPELAIGAVASDGTTWLNEALVAARSIDAPYIADGIEAEWATAQEKHAAYRRSTDPPDVANRHVVLVDDGVATGATMFVCIDQLRDWGADRITVAIPVGAPDTIEQLRTMADAVVCLEAPSSFGAVGRHYRTFEQVSDETARALLRGD